MHALCRSLSHPRPPANPDSEQVSQRPAMSNGEHRAAYLPPIGPETTQVSQGRENLDPDNGPMVTGRIDTIDHQGERAGTVLN